MNEHGLVYDYTAQHTIETEKMQFKNPYQGDLFYEILGRCRNVPEALEFLKSHDYIFPSQVLLADALGNSVIINPGIKVMKTGNYQINTNFDITTLNTGYSCGRYDTADTMLKGATDISVLTWHLCLPPRSSRAAFQQFTLTFIT